MPLKSLRVTRKEINDYYNPKTFAYQRMVNSISAIGYGQIIQKYSDIGVLETYFHEWSYNFNDMAVYNQTTGQVAIQSEAGPSFWGVSSSEGLAFLNGTYDISGLRKLKYCNDCTDGNGLPYDTMNNFQQRFSQLSSLVFGYGLYDGFLFYDLDQPRYTNVYPSVKVDDGVNVTYLFKTINGTDESLENISNITGKSPIAIEASITTAPLIKPQEGQNSVITSCCEGTSYVISGQQTIGTILYNDSLPESYCWYVESLTSQSATLPPTTFQSGGRSCGFCTKTYGCPPICEQVSMSYSTDVNLVCSQSFNDYLLASNVGKLYNLEDCGGTSPASGYYYDGKMVYYWDGITFSDYGPCPKPSSYFDLVDISSDNFNEIWSYTNSPLQQSWSDVNNFRFMYDSTYVQLSIRIISTYEPPTQGEVSNTPPKEYGLSSAGPGNTYGINLGDYLTIGCDANFWPSQTTTIPIEIQGNFGDKFNPDWRTIGTFNTTIIIPA